MIEPNTHEELFCMGCRFHRLCELDLLALFPLSLRFSVYPFSTPHSTSKLLVEKGTRG